MTKVIATVDEAGVPHLAVKQSLTVENLLLNSIERRTILRWGK